MKSLSLMTVFLALPLIGCASPPKTTFLSADGQRLSSSQTIEGDLSGCRDQARPSMLSGLFSSSGPGDKCLEDKGFVEVPEDQAEAKRAEILSKKDRERFADLPSVPDNKPTSVVRRRAGRTAVKPKRPSVSLEARPVSAKPKKKTPTNPLKLQD